MQARLPHKIRKGGCQGLGEGGMQNWYRTVTEFWFYKMKRALVVDGGDDCTTK